MPGPREPMAAHSRHARDRYQPFATVFLGSPRIEGALNGSATLARDAGRLLGSGYQLRSIEALDMFPHTPHIETLCVFTR